MYICMCIDCICILGFNQQVEPRLPFHPGWFDIFKCLVRHNAQLLSCLSRRGYICMSCHVYIMVYRHVSMHM